MKYPLFALALFSCFTAIAVEPRLDTSSISKANTSGKRMIDWISENKDIGAQDKALMVSLIAQRLLEAQGHAVEEGGPNGTERQIDQIFAKLLKKYNGLTFSDLKKILVAEFKIEAEAEQKARAEADAARQKAMAAAEQKAMAEKAAEEKARAEADAARQKAMAAAEQKAMAEKAAAEQKALAMKEAIRAEGEQKKKKQQAIFDDWLAGKPASLLELPDGAKVTSSREGRWRSVHVDGQLALKMYLAEPIGLTKVQMVTEMIPTANLETEFESLGEVFWWEPKFKEWANKMSQLAQEDRPVQYFKEIPKPSNEKKPAAAGPRDGGTNDPFNPFVVRQNPANSRAAITRFTPEAIYFVYDKTLGFGLWVGEGTADVKAALESGEVLSISKHREIMIDSSRRLLGTFFSLKHLYLASSAVNAFKSELEAFGGESPENQKASEKTKAARDALNQKLNLN